MLNGLVAFGLTRRPIILLFLAAFIVGGAVAFTRLNIEAYPNPAPAILEITAQSAGLSAEEMERLYTIPLEVGLAPTPGVNNIRSTSFYGLSFVRVTFDYGVDFYFALQQTQISLLQNVSLPNNVQPQIQASSLVGEIYRYQVTGPKHFGITNLRTVQDWILQRRFLTVPGIVQVNTWGGTTKEFEVEADLNKLEGYNLTLAQLVSAVGNANVNVGARTINIGKQSVTIRGVGLINDGGDTDLILGRKVNDLENITLGQFNGVPVQIKDVAKVGVGYVPRLGKAGRNNDDDIVAAILVMNRTLHTNDVIPRIKAEVEKINSDGTLPPGVRLVPYYDRSSLVNVTTKTVLHNLVFGCLLVFLIQWIFLGDLRSAIIVGVNIPFALFFSIIILVLRGEDANLLSLGAIDFGIIVDSAVIVVENIFRVFQAQEREELLRRRTPIGRGRNGAYSADSSLLNRIRLIYIGVTQVDTAVLFSTAVTLAAFIPLFTMQGVEGQIFNPMARTYGYALVGALLATFTVTPVLVSFLIPEHVRETETIVVRAIRVVYTPILRLALNARKFVILLGLVFLGYSVFLASNLGTEFLPALEEGNLWIRASMPPTISLEAGMPIVNRMRAIIKSHPEVITVVSQHGRPDNGSDATGFFNAEFFVPLKPFEQWEAGRTKDDLVKDLQEEFAREFTGIDMNFSQYIQDNIEEGLSGVKGANSIKIIGPDLPKLEDLANQIKKVMSDVPGVTDLGIFRVLGQPNLNIRVDRDKAARYGLNTGDINTFVQTAFGGATATTVYEFDRLFGVTVRAAPRFRDTIDVIRNAKINVTTPNGNAYIPLTEVADISIETGASYIFHERNQRFIPIKFSVRGRDLGSAVAEGKERIAKAISLPNGYRLEWAGEFEELEQAQRRLEIIVPLSLVLILGLLYALFNSFRDSLLVLTGIPFAVAGGIIALAVSGEAFGISAAIGFVSLFGVSVMNGILIMTYFNELRHSGAGTLDAMFQAATQRMRPMLMTALSACIGLLPAALSTGIGSQVQRPLAIVVVGGMFIGPIMLLVVVPALQIAFLGDGNGSEPSQSEEASEAV
ncbi:MAG: CusA/CzcA family heavy metal efflux RND transporter [Rhodomicrobium sp.]